MESSDVAQPLLEILEGDHVQGPGRAKLTLVEYGDYECPDCGHLFEIIQELRSRATGRFRLVYRHYPLSGAHPHALEAAEAAEAAAAQGRFWEMHKLLFQHQTALKHTDLLTYAGQLGLDVDRFRRELEDKVYEEHVREDFRRGVQNGVYGTPALFLNGVRCDATRDSLLSVLAAGTAASPRSG